MEDNLFYLLRDGNAKRMDEAAFLRGEANVLYLMPDKARELNERIGFEPGILASLTRESGTFRSSLEVYEEYSAGFLNIINVENLHEDMDNVLFILKKDLLCLVEVLDRDDSEVKTFQSTLEGEQGSKSIPEVFYRFLERLLRGGNRKLESIEAKFLQLEDEVVKGKAASELNSVFYGYRSDLSILRNYYEQLVDIGTDLQENRNGLLDAQAETLFGVFIAKAERLIRGVQLLGEGLMHMRDMLDAALNYNINNTMKAFTVLTAIFLPLNLLVGWYGMNFKYMPELDNPGAYPTVIAFAVIVAVGIFLLLKRKKLL
ncbi:MAG TPA: CorA family divalent cation transporter [Candidatus Limnocylindria bacterium]|nr:CorA family divalent cation transporter [Candidatus Limnocylindria bacterium]